MRVEQDGRRARATTGQWSCFHHRMAGGEPGGGRRTGIAGGRKSAAGTQAGPARRLQELYRVIAGRKAHPSRARTPAIFFEKGLDKILKKIGEESVRGDHLAAKDRDRPGVVAESADLLYHLLVPWSRWTSPAAGLGGTRPGRRGGGVGRQTARASDPKRHERGVGAVIPLVRPTGRERKGAGAARRRRRGRRGHGRPRPPGWWPSRPPRAAPWSRMPHRGGRGPLLAALGAAAFGAAPAGIIVPVGVSPAGAPDEARSLPPPPRSRRRRRCSMTSRAGACSWPATRSSPARREASPRSSRLGWC